MNVQHELGIKISATDGTAAAFSSVESRFKRASKEWTANVMTPGGGANPVKPPPADTSFLKELKGTFGRGSQFTQYAKMLGGGGAIMGVTYAAHALTEMGNQVGELSTQFRAGELSAKEFAGSIARSVPILGDLTKMFDSLIAGGMEAAGFQTERSLQATLKAREGYDKLVRGVRIGGIGADNPYEAARMLAKDAFADTEKKIKEGAKGTDYGEGTIKRDIAAAKHTLQRALFKSTLDELQSKFTFAPMDYSGETGVPTFKGGVSAADIRGSRLADIKATQERLLGAFAEHEFDLGHETARGLKATRESVVTSMAAALLGASGKPGAAFDARRIELDAKYRRLVNEAGSPEEADLYRKQHAAERENLRYGQALSDRAGMVAPTVGAEWITADYRGNAAMQRDSEQATQQREIKQLQKEHLSALKELTGIGERMLRAMLDKGLEYVVSG